MNRAILAGLDCGKGCGISREEASKEDSATPCRGFSNASDFHVRGCRNLVSFEPNVWGNAVGLENSTPKLLFGS